MTNRNTQSGSASKVIIIISSVVLVVVGLLFLTMQTGEVTSGTEQSGNASSSESQAQSDGTSATSSGSENDASTASSSVGASAGEALGDSTEAIDGDPYALDLAAESAIVINRRTGDVLYEKAPDAEQPLASLTKLTTALVALERLDATSTTETTISAQHLQAYGNEGLRARERWNIRELVGFMLIESSNDAARAVAAATTGNQSDGYAEEFIDAMNEKTEEEGWEVSYFFNPSGLDLNETLVSGGYGSARETAEILSALLDSYPQAAAQSSKVSEEFYSGVGTRYVAHNTNTWLSRFSNVTASKTGYTVLAGGNLAMGFDDLADPVVAVVLGSTKAGRFSDMLKLYNATNSYFANQSQQ